MHRSFWLLALALMTVSICTAEQFSYQFTLPTNLVLLRSANVSENVLQLTTAVNNTAGLAYYPTKVSANLGFSTNFTWVPDTCDATNGGGDGFSFFLTKNAPTSTSSGYYLGIGTTPNTFMVGYSAYLGKLFVCEWTKPTTTPFYMSPYCNGTNIGRILCGSDMNVRIFFDGTTLSVFNYTTLLVSTPRALDATNYFVGLSGGTGSAYFRQVITQWSYYSTTASFQENDNITSSDVQFFGSAQGQGSAIQLTNTGSQGGAALFGTMKIGFGLLSTFTWTPTNCDTVYNGADGFVFFASKSVPTNQIVLASSGGGLGIRYLPNTLMTGYSATFNEFYICNWTTPVSSFQSYCYTVSNPNPKYTCGASYPIEVSYTLDNKLSLSVNGSVQISSTNIVVDNTDYNVGISGGTGGGYFQQVITDWSIKATKVQTNLAIPNNYVGVGPVVSTSPVLILTNSTAQTSAAYAKDNWFYLSYKFESSFTWSGTNCNGSPSNGFTHYFSRFAPTLAQVQAAPAERLGITNVTDVYMMGYDARGRSLYVCDWGTAPTNLNPNVCSRVPMPTYVCGTAINFTLSYDSFTLKSFVNGVLTLSRTVTIYPRFYVGGFSASTDNRYMTQQITNWRFVGYYPQPNGDFSYGFGLAGANPVLRGSAQVNGNVLTLTNGFSSIANAGLVLNPQPVKMNYGFVANFNWNASNCDSDYNGGDGFAFVFTKAIPTNGSVLTSSGTALGIQYVPNVTMVGYSSYYNEFYVCSWSSPLTSFRVNPSCTTFANSIYNPNHPQRYSCNEPLVFGLNYDGYSFRLSQVTTTTDVALFTTSLPLDFSSSYYVGLSASIGEGYYQQDSAYI